MKLNKFKIDNKIEKDFKEHNVFLYKFALSILRNEEDAADAVQDTWIKAYHHINSFDASMVGGASYRGWLGMILKRICIDMIRRRKSHKYFNHVQFDDALKAKSFNAHIEQHAIYNETKLEMEKLLKNNPENIKTFRYLLDGYTGTTLRQHTGENYSKTKSQIDRVRKTIRTHFNPDLSMIEVVGAKT